DRRHDLDRGNRQGGAEEERGEQTVIGMRQRRWRHELAEREAANERYCHACDRDAQRRFADLSHELEVGLHPGQQQQQENAELCDAIEHGFLLGRVRKDGACKAGQSTPSTEGPSTMPPSSIPMTDGWPMRFMTPPRRRPTSISVMSCTRKMTSDAPAWEPSAAQAAAALNPSVTTAHRPARKHARAKLRRTVEQVMDLWNSRALNPAGQRMFPLAPSSSACGDFSEPPADAAHRWPCNCKLFATRLWRWRRIVSMAVSS